MAPREKRIETTRPPLMSPAAAERLTARPDPAPAERRSGQKRPPPAAVQRAASVESPASMAKVTPSAQAQAMKEAALTGAPFCEQCEPART